MSLWWQTLLLLAVWATATHAQTPSVTGIQVATQPNNLPLAATQYNGFKSSGGLGTQQNAFVDLNTCLLICFTLTIATCDAINYLPNAVSPTLNCNTIKQNCLTSITALTADATVTHYQFTENCFPTKRVVRLENKQLTVNTGGTQFTATSADGCGYGCSINSLCAVAEWRSSVCRHYTTANGALPSTECRAMTSVTGDFVYTVPCTTTDLLPTYSTIVAGIPTGVNPVTMADVRYDVCSAACTFSTTCVAWSYNTDTEFNGVATAARCKLYDLASETSVCTVAPTTTNPDDYLIVRNVCRNVANFYITKSAMRYSTTASLLLQANDKIEKQCAINCVANPLCRAYQFTTATGLCYHSNDEVYECQTAIFVSDATTVTNRLYPTCRRALWDIRKSASMALTSPTLLANWEACMILCRDDTACRAFVWDIDTNMCTREVGVTTTTCPVVVTAQACCYIAFKKDNCALAQGYLTSYDNMTLTGAATITASSEEECRTLCLAVSTCRGVSWERYTGVCRWIVLATTAAAGAFCDQSRSTLINAVTHSRVTCSVSTSDFTLVAGTRQIGGIVKSTYLSETSCQTNCAADPKCVSIDWNIETGVADSARCWFHYEENGACNAGRTSTCCRHYRYTKTPRCAVEENYYVYDMVQMTSVGTVQSGSSGLTACRTYCNAQTTCEGFTVDSASSNQCKTFTAAQVCTAFTACTTCIHYRKASYECMWRFRDTKKIGGTAQAAAVVTYSQCEARCRLDSTCEGFDLDPASSTPCFLHTSSSICSNVLSAVNIHHYRIRTKVCGTELAVGAWTNAVQNLHTIGNAQLSTSVLISAINCLQLCSTTSGCSGIDYDKTTNLCYSSSRVQACGTGVASNCCDRLVLPTGCTAPTVSGYSQTTDMHRLGGIQRSTDFTLAQCAALCTSETSCAAFDYNKNKACWTHTRTNECRAAFIIFSNTCCDRYVKTSACTGYAPPTFSGYTLVGLFAVRGGTEVADKPSEALCIASCSADSTCQSVDFNFSNNKCYTHTRATGCGTSTANTSSHRYTRNTITC